METKEKNNERKEQIVVAFQVGSFSKYFHKRRGTLTYLGEFNFRDILYLRYSEIFIKDVNGKKVITDEMGNIISYDDPDGVVGVLNFDEEYDTTYCKYLQDCTDEEIEVINNQKNVYIL